MSRHFAPPSWAAATTPNRNAFIGPTPAPVIYLIASPTLPTSDTTKDYASSAHTRHRLEIYRRSVRGVLNAAGRRRGDGRRPPPPRRAPRHRPCTAPGTPHAGCSAAPPSAGRVAFPAGTDS